MRGDREPTFLSGRSTRMASTPTGWQRGRGLGGDRDGGVLQWCTGAGRDLHGGLRGSAGKRDCGRGADGEWSDQPAV